MNKESKKGGPTNNASDWDTSFKQIPIRLHLTAQILKDRILTKPPNQYIRYKLIYFLDIYYILNLLL